mgnify:CR=1|tara:strand:- start:297 stop:776 length:480 start_codon:yes stop_codon:yes gene_type:complete
MTVVVWDGETLATDRQASDGSLKWETDKAWYVMRDDKPYIVSGVGYLKYIVSLREWFINGAVPNEYPYGLKDSATRITTQQLVVVDKDKGLIVYDDSPYPTVHGFVPCAFGDGKEFSYGALSMGATSSEAVGVTNEHSLHCGKGVAIYSLHKSKVENLS